MRSGLYLAAIFVCFLAGPGQAADTRLFEFNYRMLAGDIPSTGAVDVYIPLPAQNDSQRVLEHRVRSSIPGESGIEVRYGNGYYHIHRPANVNNPIDAELSWIVERRVNRPGGETLSEEERERYLQPNRLVPVGHAVLEPILEEVRALRADESPAATARAIYDWVVDNVEYRKVGTGWGNGDTFWACSERYGNCTDFHALFVALARSEGIPARFEIGFPIPLDRSGGAISGYHCWVQFYLPERGWIPIDASEAAKHPGQRELFFGTHPADRVHFTTGRDLVISEGSQRQPLNYFIYPYVELDGIPWRVNMETEFSFTQLEAH